MNLLIKIIISIYALLGAFMAGHEFGMIEGAKFQRLYDAENISKAIVNAEKRAEICKLVMLNE